MVIRLVAPCVVVLVGPSGSGKSTWAAKHFARNEIVSSDALRASVGLGPYDQKASEDAFAALDLILSRRLARRLTTVIDTLGFDDDLRRNAIEAARTTGMAAYAIGFDTPPAECRARNKRRTRPVPARVLTRQIERWAEIKGRLEAEAFDGVFTAGDAVALVPPVFSDAPAAARRQWEAPLPLEFGIQVSRFDFGDGPEEIRSHLRNIARRAEDAGFRSLWVMDHFVQIPQIGPVWHDMLESYTTLGYLAGVTERIRLGTLVTAAGYRNPAHLAKIVATLDVLSGGRAICGLGAGWFRREAEAYGLPFPGARSRLDLLEDALRLLPMMWGPGSPGFEGKLIRVPEAICYPRPVQDRIPILVGGQGERRTLRLVAELADMCNLFGDAATVRAKIGALERHCADVDRDPAEITVTHLGPALVGRTRDDVDSLVAGLSPADADRRAAAASLNAGTVADHIGRFRELADAGVRHAIVALPDPASPEAIERVGEIVAAFG